MSALGEWGECVTVVIRSGADIISQNNNHAFSRQAHFSLSFKQGFESIDGFSGQNEEAFRTRWKIFFQSKLL